MDYLSFLTPCGKYIILWKSNIRKADIVRNAMDTYKVHKQNQIKRLKTNSFNKVIIAQPVLFGNST